MFVEIIKPFQSVQNQARFAIQDLSVNELELIQEGLLELKTNKLHDAETFKSDRHACVDMFQKIDEELVKSRP